MLPLAGRARRFGDDVNTDNIISSRRKRETIDPAKLCAYLFEDVEPGFASSLQSGDMLVAGRNFGCGSAMEVAVSAVLGAGIRAVVAKSFSRTYLRNALNNGLLAICADTEGIEEGETIELSEAGDGEAGAVQLRTSSGRLLSCDPLPPFMQAMLEAGGLVAYLQRRGGFAEPGQRAIPLSKESS
ncbi:MAG: alpha-IPM isomerase [Pseudomonadota bacterium]|nr:alpha-IPM isomerase [Pseudomonadota bacterium]